MEECGQSYGAAAGAGALYSWENNFLCLLNRRPGGPQSRSGQLGEAINILTLWEMEVGFLGRSARSPVTTAIALSQLQLHNIRNT
jgi:hypothetical protein